MDIYFRDLGLPQSARSGQMVDFREDLALQADLGLALVQEVRQALREDLRLLVMSATLEVGPLAEGLSLPTVRSEVRVFPVEVSHAPPGRDQDVWDHCARQVETLAGEGTVLVFLPGVGEIERLRERLSVAMPVQVLHGRLAGDAQAAVLARAQRGSARRPTHAPRTLGACGSPW